MEARRRKGNEFKVAKNVAFEKLATYQRQADKAHNPDSYSAIIMNFTTKVE